MANNISCPVSHIMVNENRVRVTAFLVLLGSLAYWLAAWWVIPAFLAMDFFLRGFGKGRYSPFNVLSGWIVRILSIGNKPIDQAPKLFAARLGFVFALCLLVANILLPVETGYVINGVLTLFSFLESAFGFCAGCHVYTVIKRFFPQTEIN